MRAVKIVALVTLLVGLALLAACTRSSRTPAPTADAPTIPPPTAEAVAPRATQAETPGLFSQSSAGSPLAISAEGYDLVFSGGGAKGIAHVGALMELEQRGIPYRRVVGTSSGSIMALMLAAGYSANEMAMAITERTPEGKIIMSNFLDTPTSFPEEVVRNSFLFTLVDSTLLASLPDQFGNQARAHIVDELVASPVIREAFSFTEFGGVYAGDVFLSWLQEKLNQNGRNLSQRTLAEFHQETGSDLTAIVTDITDQRMLVVNHRTAPDLPVTMLIRMSMSIPLVYNNVIWEPEWGSYLGEDISGHEIIDGGVGSNFGIEMVVSSDPQFVAAMGMEPDRERVIGFYLDDAIPVPGAEQIPPVPAASSDPLQESWEKVMDRNIDLFNSLLRSHDQFIVRTHPDVVCHLPVGGFGTMEFDMSDERIMLLINAGQEAMAQCLDEMGIK